MRSIRRPLLRLGPALVCALLLTFLALAGVQAAPPATGGSWETVDARPLAGQRITALLADARGVLWAGTEERGLAAWDGRTWRTYGVPDGLPDDRVAALFADRQGRLWASTGTGLGYIPPGGSFQPIPLKGRRLLPILAIGEAEDGAILLGGAAGLSVWRPTTGVQAVPQLLRLDVLAIRTGRNGTTWLGTTDGVWRSAGGGWQRERAGRTAGPDGRIAAIAEGADGVISVVGDAGAWQLKSGAWQKLPAPPVGEPRAIAALDGTTWIGGTQGLAGGQGDIWQGYDPAVLPAAGVTSLAADRDGRLWVGTTGGLAAHRRDTGAPAIAITGINGRAPEDGSVQLLIDRIEQVQVSLDDQATPADRLLIFTRLDGVDDAPRLLQPSERLDPRTLIAYANRRLAPGAYVLRAWTQDDAFNRSPEARVTVVVPDLKHGPAGLAVSSQLMVALLVGLALVVTAGVTTGAASRTRRRRSAWEARSAAEHVRSIAERRAELYAEPLPIRNEQVEEAIAALQMRGVLLLGGEGMGKTETLGQIASDLANRAGGMLFAAAPLDLAGTPGEALFYGLARAALEALQPLSAGARPRLHWSEGAVAGYGEQEFSADLGVMLGWLQQQARRRVVLVFLLDNAGALDGYDGQHRDAFRRLVVAASAPSSPVRLVLAAESAPAVVEGFADLFHTVQLTPLSQAAGIQLLRQGARGLVDWEQDAERAAVARAGEAPRRWPRSAGPRRGPRWRMTGCTLRCRTFLRIRSCATRTSSGPM